MKEKYYERLKTLSKDPNSSMLFWGYEASAILKEIERLNNIIDKLEFNLKLNIEDLEENGFSEARIDEDKEILRFIEYLQVSDKE